MGRRPLLMRAALAVAVGVGLLFVLRISQSPTELSGGQSEIARRSDLAIEIPATGVLAAAQSVEMSAPVSSNPHFFRIEKLTAEGTMVEPGDTIMELDAQEVKRRIEDNSAEAAKTRDQRRKRELKFDLTLRDLTVQIEEARVRKETATLKIVDDPDLLSAQERREFELELEQATQNYELLKDRKAVAERLMSSELAVFDQTLANIDLRLQRARRLEQALVVKAPISGTLVYKVMADGAKRKVGEQTCHHEVILQIPNLSSLRIEATVNEQHAGSLSLGQTARVRLDALPDLSLSGRVVEIGTALQTKRDNPIKVADIIVELEPTDVRLNPGMTASLDIEVERVTNALLAPLRFVYERNGQVYTRVRHGNGRVEERPIRTGRRNAALVQVIEGLSEGETLTTQG